MYTYLMLLILSNIHHHNSNIDSISDNKPSYTVGWRVISVPSLAELRAKIGIAVLYYKLEFASDTPGWNTGATKYDKKVSIATTREQSVIVTSQLLATDSCIDDVTIGQNFESVGAVKG